MASALVVDDSKTARMVARAILVDLGFEVSEASSAAEAMTTLAAHAPPSVLLVDWNMPGQSGLELVRALRANRAYDGVPVMMVTTETMLPQVMRALESGANEYLMKPYSREMLSSKLAILGFLTGGA